MWIIAPVDESCDIIAATGSRERSLSVTAAEQMRAGSLPGANGSRAERAPGKGFAGCHVLARSLLTRASGVDRQG